MVPVVGWSIIVVAVVWFLVWLFFFHVGSGGPGGDPCQVRGLAC